MAGSGAAGFADAAGSAASFKKPTGVAVDASGNVYVADSENCRIRKITPDGNVTTLAGSATCTSVDGTGADARFSMPADIAIGVDGNLYVADGNIRKVTPAGVVTTLATYPSPIRGITVDQAGTIYFSSYATDRVYKVTGSSVVLLAGSGGEGTRDGTGAAAEFHGPDGIAINAAGNIIVADRNNSQIRQITPAGVVTTLIDFMSTPFSYPSGVAYDTAGNLYVSDIFTNRIQRIGANGSVTSVAASPGAGTGSTDGPGLSATFDWPGRLAVDSAGNIYVADTNNNKIRKISPN